MNKIGVSLSLFALATLPSFADTTLPTADYTWSNTDGGSWETTSDWLDGSTTATDLPSSSDTVSITGDSTYAVTFDGIKEVKNLIIGSSTSGTTVGLSANATGVNEIIVSDTIYLTGYARFNNNPYYLNITTTNLYSDSLGVQSTIGSYWNTYTGVSLNVSGTLTLASGRLSLTNVGAYTYDGTTYSTYIKEIYADGGSLLLYQCGDDGIADFSIGAINGTNTSNYITLQSGDSASFISVGESGTIGTYAGLITGGSTTITDAHSKITIVSGGEQYFTNNNSHSDGYYNTVDYEVASGAILGLASIGNGDITVSGTLSILDDSLDAGNLYISDGAKILFDWDNYADSAIIDLAFKYYSDSTVEADTGSIYIDELSEFTLAISNFDGVEGEEYELFGFNGTSELTADNIILDLGDVEGTWEVVLKDDTYYLVSTAVPEPSTYALIFGVLALGFVAYRKRK